MKDSSLPQPRTVRTRCLFVLGMHRSGTSALTRCLNLYGAQLPSDLAEPNEFNPTGYWESQALHRIHDELLRSNDTTWDDWREFDAAWYDTPACRAFATRLRTFLEEHFRDARLIVLKDPRVCRFYRLWDSVLDEAGMEALPVLHLRNPLEVAASLRSRDGIGLQNACLIWLRHVLDAEAATRGRRRVFSHYDTLIEDAPAALEAIGSGFGIEWPSSSSRDELVGYVDETLQHAKLQREAVGARPDIGQWISGAYAALCKLSADPADAEARAALDAIRSLLDEMQLVFAPVVAEERERGRSSAATDLALAMQGGKGLPEHMSEPLEAGSAPEPGDGSAAARGRPDDLHTRMSALERQIESLVSNHRLILDSKSLLESALQNTSDGYRSITRSFYWRITGPLRWLSRQQFDAASAAPRPTEASYAILERSGMFDERYYLETNPDLGPDNIDDPLMHFLLHGGREGRSPSPAFDTGWYLQQYPDVRISGWNPLLHYVLNGIGEGRQPKPPTGAAVAAVRVPPPPPATEGTARDGRLGALLNRGVARIAHAFRALAPRREKSEVAKRVDHLYLFVDVRPQEERPPGDRPFTPERMDITWVIPDFHPGAGGHMTIFQIVRALERFGHSVRILVQNPHYHRTADDALKTITRHFLPLSTQVRLFTGDPPLLSGDALIATDRFTCYPVQAMSGFRRKFYFVQDHETQFFPMGTEALLTERTYRMGFDCLCAGEWLADLIAQKYGQWTCSWPLAYDPAHYFTSPRDERRPGRIAFYSRHITARRAVEIGLMAFNIMAERGLDFHVDFFGTEVSPLEVDYPFTDHGLLDAPALGALYRSATVGLVFSGTNHSLVNKEMMACGLPVVDLHVDSVTSVFPPGVVEMADPSPHGVADALEALLASVERRSAVARAGLEFVDGLGWEKSARIVERAIVERIQGAEHPAPPSSG